MKLLLFKLSAVALSFSTGADLYSSRGRYELNPILAQHGEFTTRSAIIGSSATAGVLALEWFVLRHHPDLQKKFAVLNFGLSGAHLAAAVHNERQ